MEGGGGYVDGRVCRGKGERGLMCRWVEGVVWWREGFTVKKLIEYCRV